MCAFHVRIHVRIIVCFHVRIYVCIHVFIHVFIHVRIYVRIHVRASVYKGLSIPNGQPAAEADEGCHTGSQSLHRLQWATKHLSPQKWDRPLVDGPHWIKTAEPPFSLQHCRKRSALEGRKLHMIDARAETEMRIPVHR
jgi:hypothetical protein